VEYALSTRAGETYYVRVSGIFGSLGTYSLTLSPLKRFDRLEPNDEITAAKPLSPGQTIEAGIMDDQDPDYYQVRAAAAGTLTATLKNTSTTLAPWIGIYDEQKNRIHTDHSVTPGADLDRAFAVEPGKTYYVHVSGGQGSSGSYTLVVK
jgi:hypothetical protein